MEQFSPVDLEFHTVRLRHSMALFSGTVALLLSFNGRVQSFTAEGFMLFTFGNVTRWLPTAVEKEFKAGLL